jgi:4-hydroxy-4-methyl-2-oxoglutarate aldolase
VNQEELFTYLAGQSSPTVANAIEQFRVRPDAEGFTGPQVRCLFPDLPPVCGTAFTITVRRASSAGAGYGIFPVYEALSRIQGPKLVVLKDLSGGAAAFAGEIMAATFLKLGVRAIITDGLVRDLDEVRGMGLHYFAAGTVASHGDLTIDEIGGEVEIAGIKIKPGDLLHGDKHGLVVLPWSVLDELPAVIGQILEKERKRLALLADPNFSVEMLRPKQ